MNFLFFVTFYFLIIFSTVGYGFIIKNFCYKAKINDLELGFTGLFGISFLILYSYLSSIFYSHNSFHNFLILGGGFFLFLINIKNIFIKINNFKFILIIFTILLIANLTFKTHDDFPYYHFPYSYYLTQNSAIFGIGHLNHGFRTASSIFYLNSIFYLPIVKFYMFHLSATLVFGFANAIFLEKIYKNFKEKNLTFITYFSLLSFMFINIFFL